ncbi:MAG: LPXTG cell wall anchor domain-containing protein [Ruminococcus sp.]|nr:LPXTG cell wall anchor domain-containing protein [Ruminococcus sp.]
MKKFLALMLALMIAASLVVTVSAATTYESPTPTDYYSITTATEGSGSASADPVKVEKNSDGTSTLTATDNDGFFTRWIIDGSYQIVSGDLESNVIVIKPLSDITATASFSVDEDYLTITAEAVGAGTASADPGKVLKGSGDTSTLTAVEQGGTFVKWELQCDYEIVEGSLTSKVLVIRPLTDVHAIAYFKEANPDAGKKDDSSTSPKTGDMSMIFAAMMLLATGAAVFAVKKIKE